MFSKSLTALQKTLVVCSLCFLPLNHSLASPQSCQDIFEIKTLNLEGQKQILKWLTEKNPDLSRKQLIAKLGDATDTFTFYREFVANFYDLIKSNPDLMKNLGELIQHTGWMLGDPHLKNFGSVILEDGSAIFTMTDLDDGGHGPISLDVVRFLTSAIIFDPATDTKSLLDSYYDGLRGKSHERNRTIERFLKTSAGNGKLPTKELFDLKTNLLTRDESVKEIDPAELESLKAILRQNYNEDFEIVDQTKFIRSRGGSGGLSRYDFLLKTKKNELFILEFKEMTTSGMVAFADQKIPTPKRRVRKGLEYTQGQDSSNLFSYAKIGDSRFELRPRFAGNVNVTLDNANPQDSMNMIHYEAWTLGMIHRRTADDAKAYARAFKKNRQAIESTSRTLKLQFSQIFEKLKSLVNKSEST